MMMITFICSCRNKTQRLCVAVLFALTEACLQADYTINDKGKETNAGDYRTFATRKKCTIPCGGVGLMPREKVASYDIQTSCNVCTDWSACPSCPACPACCLHPTLPLSQS